MVEVRVRYISIPEINDPNYEYTFTIYGEDGSSYELNVPSSVMELFYLNCVLKVCSAFSRRLGKENEELSQKLNQCVDISNELRDYFDL